MPRIAKLCIVSLAGGSLLAALWGPPAIGKPGAKSERTSSGPRERVAATVNGEPIYLNTLNSPDIAKTRRKLYGLERSMLRKVVLEKLRKEKPNEFRNGKIYLTEDDIRRVYMEAGLSSRGTLASFRGRIRSYLIRTKTQQMEDAQFQEAVRKGYVTSSLIAPPPYLFRLKRVNRPGTTLGPKNAAVTVVEFSDFQ